MVNRMVPPVDLCNVERPNPSVVDEQLSHMGHHNPESLMPAVLVGYWPFQSSSEKHVFRLCTAYIVGDSDGACGVRMSPRDAVQPPMRGP
jgi:hypothetical protein